MPYLEGEQNKTLIMTGAQNSITKFFVETVNTLIDKGEIASYEELVDKLKWNKTSMSNVVNGRRNVPMDVYKKFAEMYQTDTVVHVNNSLDLVVNKVITIEAVQRVFLMGLAELLAAQRKEPVAKVLSALEAAANQQAESAISKLSP